MYSIYALAGPLESITWRNIVYIGASRRPEYRYAQHIACATKSQEEKNDWVKALLAQGQKPSMWLLQGDIEGVEDARACEQHFIRYAMSQGASLFNRQITYTDEERNRIHANRATYYAKIEELLRRGYFVKRSAHWHPSLPPFNREGKPVPEPIEWTEFHCLTVKNEQGDLVSLDRCSNEFFDAFIKQYLSVIDSGDSTWEFEDRVHAINVALARECALDLHRQERPLRKQSKIKK